MFVELGATGQMFTQICWDTEMLAGPHAACAGFLTPRAEVSICNMDLVVCGARDIYPLGLPKVCRPCAPTHAAWNRTLSLLLFQHLEKLPGTEQALKTYFLNVNLKKVSQAWADLTSYMFLLNAR